MIYSLFWLSALWGILYVRLVASLSLSLSLSLFLSLSPVNLSASATLIKTICQLQGHDKHKQSLFVPAIVFWAFVTYYNLCSYK